MPNLPFLVAGDVHGSPAHLQHAATHALRNGITTIIQVGDFWLYDHEHIRIKVDRMLGNAAKQRGLDPEALRVYFCDGNHENFNILDPHATAPVHLSRNVTYMPRGTTIELDGHKVGFLGGAASIDRDWRTEGVSWWPEERMSNADIDRALDMGPLDVLVTHEAPTPVFDNLRRYYRHAAGKTSDGHAEREAVQAVMEATQPDWLVHGHHHSWGSHRLGNTTVVSLAADADAGHCALLHSSRAPKALDGRAWNVTEVPIRETPIEL